MTQPSWLAILEGTGPSGDAALIVTTGLRNLLFGGDGLGGKTFFDHFGSQGSM
jgi:hypothetical protein